MRASEGLERRVRVLLEEHLHLRVPSRDTDLIESGAIDSLALVELLLELEREFGVTIPLQELELAELRTIPSITGLVARYASRGGTSVRRSA
jgi:acyl carrier protein